MEHAVCVVLMSCFIVLCGSAFLGFLSFVVQRHATLTAADEKSTATRVHDTTSLLGKPCFCVQGSCGDGVGG
jgi:hypothetical protein